MDYITASYLFSRPTAAVIQTTNERRTNFHGEKTSREYEK